MLDGIIANLLLMPVVVVARIFSLVQVIIGIEKVANPSGYSCLYSLITDVVKIVLLVVVVRICLMWYELVMPIVLK